MVDRNFNTISEFYEYKKNIQLSYDFIFQQYLSKIYENLSQREECIRHSNSIKVGRHLGEVKTKEITINTMRRKDSFKSLRSTISDKGICLQSFLDYMDIQDFIGERIYKFLLCKFKTNQLVKESFINGLNHIYYGDIQHLIQLTFFLGDFNNDGLMYKTDMKLILTYIPCSTELLQKIHIRQINKIINNFFENNIKKSEESEEKEINFETFTKYIKEYNNENNSSNNLNLNNVKSSSELFNEYNNNAPFFYFISLVSYLFKNTPFNSKNVENLVYSKKKMKLIDRNRASFGEKRRFSTSKKDIESLLLRNFIDNKLNFSLIGKTTEQNKNKLKVEAALMKIEKKNLFKTQKSSDNINYVKKEVHLTNGKTDKKRDFIIAKEKEIDKENKDKDKDKEKDKTKRNVILGYKEKKKYQNIFNKNLFRNKKSVSPTLEKNDKSEAHSPLLNYNNSYLNKSPASPKMCKNISIFNSSETNGSSSNNNSSKILLKMPAKVKLPSIVLTKDRQRDYPLSSGRQSKEEKDNGELDDLVLCEYSQSDDENGACANRDSLKNDCNENGDSNELYLYKNTEENNQCTLNKFYAVLSEKEIFFFSSDLKNELCDLWYINKTYISVGKECINGTNYYTIKIEYNNNKVNKLYFLSEKVCVNFSKNIKNSIKNLDFQDYYELSDVLGSGHFGKVCKCKKKSDGQIYAVKIINKCDLKFMDLELVKREKNYLKLIKHPSIICLRDYYENTKNIYLITDCYTGGDIFSFIENNIKQNKEISEKTAAKIIKKIAEGIRYLNYFGIIHRDIKPENILFGEQDDINTLKLIDLGVCQTLSYGELANDPIGTNGYIPPEIYMHNNYSFKIDIWSLGIILYLLITGGILPFEDENMDETIVGKKVIFLHQEYPENYFGKKSKGLIHLLDKMLEKNDKKRININELIKDKWFENAKK